MEEIKSMLHLDVMTVTGKTLGENLEELKQNGFYEKCSVSLEKWGLKRTDVIRPFDNPIGSDGTVAILRGNLAPEGSVVKHSAVPAEMFQAVLKARPFDCEEDAIAAVLSRKTAPEMRSLSVTKARRDRGCRKCSILRKLFLPIRSLADPLH